MFGGIPFTFWPVQSPRTISNLNGANNANTVKQYTLFWDGKNGRWRLTLFFSKAPMVTPCFMGIEVLQKIHESGKKIPVPFFGGVSRCSLKESKILA